MRISRFAGMLFFSLYLILFLSYFLIQNIHQFIDSCFKVVIFGRNVSRSALKIDGTFVGKLLVEFYRAENVDD